MNKVQVLNTGLNYTYDANDSNLFANFSQSFRFPMTDEMYSPGYASPEYTSAGGLNINLDTQKANNFDLGLRHYFRKNIYSGITFYRMDVRNEIYYNQYIDENMNYDKTLHQGIEFESKMRLGDKANLFANYTCCIAKFIKGEFGGNSIPAVPLHKWSAGFDIDLLKALNFSLVTNYVGERNFLSDQKDNFPPLGSYTTVDIKLAYNKDNFSVYGGINNLFNEDYSEYGVVSNYYMNKNYYPSRRRNFIFGSSLKF
jgi:outer membrane receptor protein involved in Fe transport